MPRLTATTDLLHLFGDPTRVRLLALLARHELTVAELTTILEVAQSRVSTHLGPAARGRAAARPAERRIDASTRSTTAPCRHRLATLWTLLERQVEDAVLESDAAALRGAAAGARPVGRLARRRRGRDGAALLAGPHLGSDRAGVSRSGPPRRRARRRIGRRRDGRAAGAARAHPHLPRPQPARAGRGAGSPRSACRTCATCAASWRRSRRASRAFDHVLLFNVLASARHPARAIAEAARVLRPGGGVTLVTLDEHAHGDSTARYGHVHPGFKPPTIKRWLTQAGFQVETLRGHVARAPPAALRASSPPSPTRPFRRRASP